MPELILDGRPLRVAEGTTVAAALALGGDGSSRTSVSSASHARRSGTSDIAAERTSQQRTIGIIKQYVLGFHVTMHHPAHMRVVQRL